MTTPLIRDLPYRPDSSVLFEALASRAWPVFLDSGRPTCTQGRYDILTAEPSATLVTRGLRTELHDAHGTRASLADPFTLLDETLGPRRPRIPGLPFCGGAIGYFAYDLARRLERLPSLAEDAEGIPDMAVGIYDWALVVDHARRRSRLVAQDEACLHEWLARLAPALSGRRTTRAPNAFRVLDRVRSNLGHGEYLTALARIKHYLHEGDCYQVNLAQRFAVPAEGDPWQAYKGLRIANAAPFGAYLSTPDCHILCSSPERFLSVCGDRVETKPIKGTRPRGSDAVEDRMLAQALRNSVKDRAENLMIVDLLRNDLGKVCAIGSVHVPTLFAIESYARVHHLVSTVRGRLAEGRTALDLLRACFPGGSITGAPKLRAMEIIEELEPQRRGVYCGSIGYLGYDGTMDTNIAIRTLVHSAGVTRLWAGGGIVADSDPEAEYRETYDKAAPLLDLLERLRLDHVGS
ncbi:aminodeoxychorismate synthase component I [Thiocapsa rosea]|uniref:aminodeoxychorismate synthase n=1 Tax=Thiocapsa rosea TaxID=69360 RepID=A0A495VEL3_9GAMM|nr:aminodeoxychorismate synthase component I [Thiocapsa rosea]RKT46268.1 para-aminobenzoate synthetase component 1 [Thiocapsa rosea]